MIKGAAGTAGGMTVAVPAALFCVAAGTMLHRQVLSLAGLNFPLGLFGALVLIGAVQVLVGAWSRSMAAVAVLGGLSYAAAGWLAMAPPGQRLILGDFHGNAWVFGIAVVTLLVMVWVRRFRRPGART